MRFVKNNPDERVLIIYVVAGRGMQLNGFQGALLNQFDSKKGWYKFWGVEGMIRVIVKNYPNTY